MTKFARKSRFFGKSENLKIFRDFRDFGFHWKSYWKSKFRDFRNFKNRFFVKISKRPNFSMNYFEKNVAHAMSMQNHHTNRLRILRMHGNQHKPPKSTDLWIIHRNIGYRWWSIQICTPSQLMPQARQAQGTLSCQGSPPWLVEVRKPLQRVLRLRCISGGSQRRRKKSGFELLKNATLLFEHHGILIHLLQNPKHLLNAVSSIAVSPLQYHCGRTK